MLLDDTNFCERSTGRQALAASAAMAVVELLDGEPHDVTIVGQFVMRDRISPDACCSGGGGGSHGVISRINRRAAYL